MSADELLKKVVWLGSSRKNLRAFPAPVRDHIGYALYMAQCGSKHPDAKPLSGFGGAGVLEVVSDYRGDTFRAVYTLRFADTLFVLHAFQKKSQRASRRDLDLARHRLRALYFRRREL